MEQLATHLRLMQLYTHNHHNTVKEYTLLKKKLKIEQKLNKKMSKLLQQQLEEIKYLEKIINVLIVNLEISVE